MTVNEMISELSQRLEDANASEFPDTMKVDALNNAQNRLVDLLHGEYLTELEVREEYQKGANTPKMVLGVLDGNLSDPKAYVRISNKSNAVILTFTRS